MLGMFRLCWTLLLALQMASAADRLYSEDDGLAVLSGAGLTSAVTNSSSAWLVQFFSSWCGHCVHFSAAWKELARDVQDWQQVINMAVLDCAQEDNYDACKEYNIKFYPTFKYFHAHCPPTDKGTSYRGADRQVQSMRRLMVDILQNHTREHLPDHCPPLEPWRYQTPQQCVCVCVSDTSVWDQVLGLCQNQGHVHMAETKSPKVDTQSVSKFCP